MTSLPELLADLAAAPELPGARCVGSHDLYDAAIIAEREGSGPENRDYARAAALQLCRTCPALVPCCAWLNGLPADQRPVGVVAGRIVNPAKPPSLKSKNAERADRFAALHQSRMSTGDIAAVTGCSTSTVRRALTQGPALDPEEPW